MTNEEQKLREFADKWGIREDDEPTFDPHTENPYYGYSRRTKQCLSDLTALISEHYYPKEFVEWFIREEVFMGELTEKFITNNHGNFKSLDELYQYWKDLVDAK